MLRCQVEFYGAGVQDSYFPAKASCKTTEKALLLFFQRMIHIMHVNHHHPLQPPSGIFMNDFSLRPFFKMT